MDLGLTGKRALVTGASAGIGRAIARELANEGVTVCLAARREPLLEELAAEIVEKGGPQPVIATVDLLDPDEPGRLAQRAVELLGGVDILINAAGGSRNEIDWVTAPDEEWEREMVMNYTQIRRLTMPVVDQMRPLGWGRIVNITGKAEPAAMLGCHPAKAAVHNWAKGLSREVGPYGITVNSLPPGKIMSEQILRKYTPEFREEFAKTQIPVGRFGEPEEMAYIAACLCSPRAAFVTGNVLHVDGGQHRFAF